MPFEKEPQFFRKEEGEKDEEAKEKGAKSSESQREGKEKKRAEEQDNKNEGTQRYIGKVFDKYKDNSKRVEDILYTIKPFLDSDLTDGEKIRQSLEKCSTIEDKEEFKEKIISSLRPILDLEKENPEAFEEIEREAFVEGSSFTRINEILSYGIDEEHRSNEEHGSGKKELVHIHLAPAKTFGPVKSRRLVREGFKELAEIVNKNKKIEVITATSWIIAKHPNMINKLGFTDNGEIGEEKREEYFSEEDDDIEIHEARMTREEFLEKYLP